MPIDVTVIVPVYNPGVYIQPLLDSLDRQSIGWSRMEAIFVDDGSTDTTPALLDEWARTRPTVTVVHQENHGWPGQPRNVAIERAQGRYIQFVDQDDWLGDTALDELVTFADENTSDVIVGKMVGIKRRVPTWIFRTTVPKVTIGRERVQDSQTPHKMFRRAFLNEIGLRFPEGKRRLEDHVFVTSAYLQASVVSVYSETDCYFHISRDDGGNAGFRAYDPVAYYAAVDEVLDIIDARLTDPAVRDAFAIRWLRSELVGRLHNPSIRKLPRDKRHAFYREISRVLRSRFSLSGTRAGTRHVQVSACVIRHATAEEWDRYADAVDAMTVTANVTDGVRAYLRGRVLPQDARVSDFLQRVVPRIAEAVVADLEEDFPLVPPQAGTRTAAGKTFTVHLAVADRECVMASGPPTLPNAIVRHARPRLDSAARRAKKAVRPLYRRWRGWLRRRRH